MKISTSYEMCVHELIKEQRWSSYEATEFVLVLDDAGRKKHSMKGMKKFVDFNEL